MKVIIATLAALGIIVGGWYGYWALARGTTSARYAANTQNQQYQAGLISQERDRVQGWDVATDPAQKAQIASTFCAVYLTVNPTPKDLVVANGRICH